MQRGRASSGAWDDIKICDLLIRRSVCSESEDTSAAISRAERTKWNLDKDVSEAVAAVLGLGHAALGQENKASKGLPSLSSAPQDRGNTPN